MTIPKCVKDRLPKWDTDPYHVEFIIGKYSNTREFGYGFPVLMRLVHKDDNGEAEETIRVSMCQYQYSAEAKIAELQEYVNDQRAKRDKSK